MSHISWKGYWRGRFPDGLPHQRSREVVRPTGGIVRGKFPSRKTGRMVHHEGLLELDALYLFETSPLISSYTEQPQPTYYPAGAQLRRYTPDFELTLVTGERVFVEVKPKRNAECPEIQAKLSQVAEHYARSQTVFLVLTDEVIRVEPRLSNLRWIYHQAPRIQPSHLKGLLALQRLASYFPVPVRKLQQLLSGLGLDSYCLLMTGGLICDLNHPISLDTALTLNLENKHEWFRISDQFNF